MKSVRTINKGQEIWGVERKTAGAQHSLTSMEASASLLCLKT